MRSVFVEQRQAPLRQLPQRRDRPGDDDIGAPGLLDDAGLFGAATDDRHGQAVAFDEVGEELRAPQQRFDERDSQIRSREGQGDSRKPGPAADVDDRGALGDQFLDHRAVQNVPVPQAGTSRGPTSPHSTPSVAKRLVVLAGGVHPVPEQPLRHRRRRFVRFHVKHPPPGELHRCDYGTSVTENRIARSPTPMRAELLGEVPIDPPRCRIS